MNTSDAPFSYLAVIPPEAPQGNIRLQDTTAERLARHVAVLFGVDVPDNPAGGTWVADYERLRVNEIARGELSGIPNPTDEKDLDVIATATLQKYGPDNKAALVLAGCEVLFNSVVSVFDEVLGIIAVSNDGEPVANPTIFAAWSLLVADMFRAQPALTAAAIQARAVQAKTSLEWRMAPTNLSLAPSERPRALSFTEESPIYPQELSVLDRTIPSGVDLLSPGYGEEASNHTLVKSLVNKWCHYILGSADQAVAWIISDPSRPDSHRAEAFLPITEPARTFLSDVLAISPWVRPMSKHLGEVTDPELFLRSDEDHINRLLPGMYSARELVRLQPRSQRALLMTHMQVLQLFGQADDFTSAYLKARCREDAGQIVHIARRLWGETDPMTVMLGMTFASMELTDSKDTLGPEDVRRLYRVLVDGYATIDAARRSGIVSEGVWVGLVHRYSSDMRQATEYEYEYDRQKAEVWRETHREYWRSVTEKTGLRDAWKLAYVDSPDPLPLTAMNALLHNYLALPFRSGDFHEMMTALRFSRNKMLPLRQRVMESRKSETPYRHTLQTTVRPIYNLLQQGNIPPEDEAWLVATAVEFEERLRETAMGRRFLGKDSHEQRDPNQNDLNFLGSLVRAQVSILEHQHLSSTPFDEMLKRAVNTLKVAWETYEKMLKQERAQAGRAVKAAPGTARFSEFADYADRVRKVVDSNADALPQHIRDDVAEVLSEVEEIRRAVEPDPESG